MKIILDPGWTVFLGLWTSFVGETLQYAVPKVPVVHRAFAARFPAPRLRPASVTSALSNRASDPALVGICSLLKCTHSPSSGLPVFESKKRYFAVKAVAKKQGYEALTADGEDPDGKWSRLAKWAWDGGMRWNSFKIGDNAIGIRGAIATRPIAEGHVIVSTPIEATLFVSPGDSCPLPRSFIDPSFWDEIHDFWNIKLALLLLYEQRLGPSSRFAPYIAVLPSSISTPLCFSDRDLGQLQWPPFIAQIRTDRDYYASKHARLRECMAEPPAMDHFFWAIACAGSRTFTADFGDDSFGDDSSSHHPHGHPGDNILPDHTRTNTNNMHADDTSANRSILLPDDTVSSNGCNGRRNVCNNKGELMCPIADMVNHDHRAAPAFRWDAVSRRFELFSPFTRAPPSAAAGGGGASDSEITISYGEGTSEELLHHYGFVPAVNRFDHLVLHEADLLRAAAAAAAAAGRPAAELDARGEILRRLVDSPAGGLTLPLRKIRAASCLFQVQGASAGPSADSDEGYPFRVYGAGGSPGDSDGTAPAGNLKGDVDGGSVDSDPAASQDDGDLLLLYARVLTMPLRPGEGALSAALRVQGGLPVSPTRSAGSSSSAQSESAASRRLLAEVCRSHLDSMPTTLSDDLALAAQLEFDSDSAGQGRGGDSDGCNLNHVRLAVQYRIGKKRLLLAALSRWGGAAAAEAAAGGAAVASESAERELVGAGGSK